MKLNFVLCSYADTGCAALRYDTPKPREKVILDFGSFVDSSNRTIRLDETEYGIFMVDEYKKPIYGENRSERRTLAYLSYLHTESSLPAAPAADFDLTHTCICIPKGSQIPVERPVLFVIDTFCKKPP